MSTTVASGLAIYNGINSGLLMYNFGDLECVGVTYNVYS